MKRNPEENLHQKTDVADDKEYKIKITIKNFGLIDKT